MTKIARTIRTHWKDFLLVIFAALVIFQLLMINRALTRITRDVSSIEKEIGNSEPDEDSTEPMRICGNYR